MKSYHSSKSSGTESISIRSANDDIVGVSALLTPTMTYMPSIIEALEKARLKNKVKVMIGGTHLPMSSHLGNPRLTSA